VHRRAPGKHRVREALHERVPHRLRFKAFATFVIDPPVSHMSSTIKQLRPSTSPTTFMISASFAFSRRLSHKASSASRRFA
jgi:hypothetical protein